MLTDKSATTPKWSDSLLSWMLLITLAALGREGVYEIGDTCWVVARSVARVAFHHFEADPLKGGRNGSSAVASLWLLGTSDVKTFTLMASPLVRTRLAGTQSLSGSRLLQSAPQGLARTSDLR